MIHVQLNVESPALRAGLASLIGDEPDMEVSEAAAPSTDGSPIVVVTTSVGDEGESAWDALAPLGTSVLLLRDQPVALQELRVSPGARGILPLDATAEELYAAIRALAVGLTVGTDSLLRSETERVADPGPLTEREIQVLGLLASGLANKQIALELAISEHTVKFHVSSIYAKLNASSRTQAVREGLRRGWITV